MGGMQAPGRVNTGAPAMPAFGQPMPSVAFGAGAPRNTGSGGGGGGDRFDAYNKNTMMNQRRY